MNLVMFDLNLSYSKFLSTHTHPYPCLWVSGRFLPKHNDIYCKLRYTFIKIYIYHKNSDKINWA